MSVQLFEVWEKAKANTHYAKCWQDLPNQKSHLGDRFLISPAHSSIKLVRAGQHSQGSQNYHDSPDALNKALLVVLAKEGDALIEKAIAYLKQQETLPLINCQDAIRKMQSAINAATTEGCQETVE